MCLKHWFTLTVFAVIVSVMFAIELDDYDFEEVVAQLKSPIYVTTTTATPTNFEIPDYSILYDDDYLDQTGKTVF